MGQFKGTPGPWKTAATDDSLILSGRQKIASTYEVPGDIWGANNARLIAAAPNLLEALQRWSNAMWQAGVSPVKDSHDPMEAMLFDTHAAIAKALGVDE